MVRIVQIVTAAPLRRDSKKPFLFGLDETGMVMVYDWIEKNWTPLSKIDADDD